MISALTAAYVLAGKLRRESIQDAVALYTQMPAATTSLGFPSQAEGTRELRESIEQFIQAPPDEWPRILFANIGGSTLPDKSLTARLMLGCAHFGLAAKNMVGVLGWKTT